jgi:hypothetical protein
MSEVTTVMPDPVVHFKGRRIWICELTKEQKILQKFSFEVWDRKFGSVVALGVIHDDGGLTAYVANGPHDLEVCSDNYRDLATQVRRAVDEIAKN